MTYRIVGNVTVFPLKKAFDRYKLELIVEKKISLFTCGAILHFPIHKLFPALVAPFLKYSKLIGQQIIACK